MKLKNYIYVDNYIKERQYLFFEIKKTSKSNLQYLAAADSFVDELGIGNIYNELPVSDKVKKIVCECARKCSELLLVEDKEGIMVAIYYYMFKLKMADISEILSMSTRTCWRHLDIAIKQFNIVLQLLSECA